MARLPKETGNPLAWMRYYSELKYEVADERFVQKACGCDDVLSLKNQIEKLTNELNEVKRRLNGITE